MNKRHILGMMVIASLLLVMAVSVVSADESNDIFDVNIYHGINGRSLGASKDFPVDIWVNDAEVFSNVTFGQRLNAELPPGDYNIKIYSDDLGAFVESMEVQADGVPAGVEVFFHAKFSAEKTPILKVKVR